MTFARPSLTPGIKTGINDSKMLNTIAIAVSMEIIANLLIVIISLLPKIIKLHQLKNLFSQA